MKDFEHREGRIAYRRRERERERLEEAKKD